MTKGAEASSGNPARHVLAANLKRLRSGSGLSQEDLAARASLHRTYISSIERAERNVTIENIFALAAALGADPRELLAPISTEQL